MALLTCQAREYQSVKTFTGQFVKEKTRGILFDKRDSVYDGNVD